ncbi:MAG TPA: hypothetical protein PKD39_12130, partial [Chitinophagales bacterium]|nr:hypothetical protein [Chitinophagales bacterium]HNA39383.1 hypothetical protein [Chitinophagales bacterium]
RGPPACKAGALNQLSYAPSFLKRVQRYKIVFHKQASIKKKCVIFTLTLFLFQCHTFKIGKDGKLYCSYLQ